ncbi:MAG TPA: Ig-like domain repeat protein [Bryobacteraceae bacterium]|nr:Ig-like domain repeat protein [Bryobacteraceae bacterium]
MSPRRLAFVVVGSLAGLLVAGRPAAAQWVPHTGPALLTSPVPASDRPPHNPAGGSKEKPLGRPPRGRPSGNLADPVVQTSTSSPAAAQALGQWEGLGVGLAGFTPTAVPPDPNMAVGPNHIVQWVNNAMVVFDKQGKVLQAPVPDSTFWGGAAQTCDQFGGFSDPIVKYDRAADRWIVGEVALPFFTEFVQCFAVSKTSDPTFTMDASGANTSYYIWAYGFNGNLNDYDKIAVWPDGYYMNWNIFDATGANFLYPEACAWNRDDMLAGAAAPRFVCFKNLANNFASLLSSDWDGSTPPPAGSPNYLMEVDTVAGVLEEWQFHVDYATPSKSTLTGPTVVSGAAPFSTPCPAADPSNCIRQPGTTQNLDSFSDRLMYRLAYRNFGDHESIVANHTVSAGANTGVRWYEVRNPGGTPTVYQQGTFAPDSDSRWMASVAMDQSGNIGVGYSVSSTSTHPSIRYSGWEVGNPLGILQAETHLVDGGGSQTGANRWGDYSAMQVDPADDCTFWYTQEYEAVTQSTDWNTRIGSFKFPSCGQALTPTTTTLGTSGTPSTYGQTVTFTATVSPSAAPGTVQFYIDGSAAGSPVALSGGTASLSTAGLSGGSHSVTASYSGTSTYASSTSSTLTQNVNEVATTTTLTSSPNPSNSGQTVTFTAKVSPSAAPGTVQFYIDGGAAGSPVPLSGGTATLTTSSLSAASHAINATYSGNGNYAGSIASTLTQVVNSGAANFTIAAAPSSQTVHRGSSVGFTVTIAPSNLFSASVSLSVTGLPSRSSANFSINPVPGGSGSSTLTITTGNKTPLGTKTLTIKGTSGALVNTVKVSLTVIN